MVSCGEGESASILFRGVRGFVDGLKILLETFSVESVEELHQAKKSYILENTAVSQRKYAR